MGTIELDKISKQLTIYSNILFYGNLASQQLLDQCVEEIEAMWNEPGGTVKFKGIEYAVVFTIRGYLFTHIKPEDIFENRNPKNNYFRIEEFAPGDDISFVDGIFSNTGYFKAGNLYPGSTTAAHEYGHTLGLEHPENRDLRGKGTPGIMYPRGTLVNPEFQYNPAASIEKDEAGHTMHPMHRRVLKEDIDNLKLGSYNLSAGKTIVIGQFSSVYHEAFTPLKG